MVCQIYLIKLSLTGGKTTLMSLCFCVGTVRSDFIFFPFFLKEGMCLCVCSDLGILDTFRYYF